MYTQNVSIQCSEDLLARFSEKAKQDELSRSTIIRALIEAYVDGMIDVRIKVTVK